MKHKVLIFITVLFVFVLGVVVYTKKFAAKKKIHYHAGFQVYKDGKKQEFSNIKYMNIQPCTENEKEYREDEQIEKAHLHDLDGDVVHVEAEGAKWKDLFTNIHFSFDSSKPLLGYVNGKKVDSILNYPIRAEDSVVIFSGKNPNVETALKGRITKKRIKSVGKKKKNTPPP